MLEEERKDAQNNKKTINKLRGVRPQLPIVILSINGLNSPIKRYKMA